MIDFLAVTFRGIASFSLFSCSCFRLLGPFSSLIACVLCHVACLLAAGACDALQGRGESKAGGLLVVHGEEYRRRADLHQTKNRHDRCGRDAVVVVLVVVLVVVVVVFKKIFCRGGSDVVAVLVVVVMAVVMAVIVVGVFVVVVGAVVAFGVQ